MVCSIKLNSVDDAVKLTEMALSHDGKLLVNSGSMTANARSLLALFALIGKSNLQLVAPDHDKPEKFLSFLDKIQELR